MDLAISIINYKTKDLSEKCIKSILEKKWKINYQIWLVDNASNDGSLEYLKENFPKVNFIKSNNNLGFAGGHNLALKKIKNSRYIAILNSDTEVTGEVLDGMVKFLDENEKIGVASCKVLGFDRALQPNGGDLPLGFALINWLFNLDFPNFPNFHRNEQSYYEREHEVGWVSGNFMVINRKVIESIGLFDDKYFMYFEDADFCFRAKKKGFSVWINPKYSIKHLSGGSLDDPKFRQWSGEYKGLIYFYKKNFGIFESLVVKLLIYVSTIFRMIAFALTGRLSYAKTYGKVLASLR